MGVAVVAWLCTVPAAAPATSYVPAFGMNFLGSEDYHLTHPEAFPKLGGAGIRYLRVNFAWYAVERSCCGAYDWSQRDALVRRAAEHNQTILPILYGSPMWLKPSANHPPRSPGELEHFKRFSVAVTRRYGAAGSFWYENPTVPYRPLLAYQVWNEPNTTAFWDRRPDPGAYLQLIRAARDGLRSVDPRNRVIFAGLAARPDATALPNWGSRRFLVEFLDRYAADGSRGVFDAAAIHPYATLASQASDHVHEIHSALAERSLPVDVWITEVGWASGSGPGYEAPGGCRRSDGAGTEVTVPDETAQDAKLRAFVDDMSRRRMAWRIGPIMWYHFQDEGSVDCTVRDWYLWAGLSTPAAGPRDKPAWYSYSGYALAGGDIPLPEPR